jgi:hypothetical protein
MEKDFCECGNVLPCPDCWEGTAVSKSGSNGVLCLTWFEAAEPGKECMPDTRCEDVETNGNCDSCRTMDGRGIEEINCYASTCDACGELTMHEELEMNEENQLGTCPECLAKGLKA